MQLLDLVSGYGFYSGVLCFIILSAVALNSFKNTSKVPKRKMVSSARVIGGIFFVLAAAGITVVLFYVFLYLTWN